VPHLELRDGVPLYYEEHGSGEPIVLVPGWTITTRFWERQVADLARDHRVVTLDLRGAGNSGKTPDGHSLAGYAADVEELLERLDLRDATLVGYAMAVSVGVHLLAGGRDANGRVARFVWVDHSPRFFTAPGWPFALFGDLTPAAFDETVGRLRHERPAVTRELLDVMFEAPEDWMYAELLKTPTDVAAAMLATVANVDLRPLLPALELPVLLVNGRRSAVPHEVGAWLARELPDARAIVLEAGHAPFWDDAEAFNRAVRAFEVRRADT
jgi:pimeloyl-ACP methyl ester carboxylesterase